MARQQPKKPGPVKQPEDLRSAIGRELPFSRVLLLFAAAFLVHVLLNILVNESPTVVIDEGLYTNIARSLAWEGKLSFRGQPVNYPYLLYPFLLVPVYWLNSLLGADIYRMVQVFNTLLMTSAVFPAYCLAKDFTKDSRKAFLTALIVALMPDMLMGGFEMTECLIWPLFFWMLFFCFRFFTTDRLNYGLLTALFTGLLFAAKPGAVAAGAVMLTAHLIRSLRGNKAGIKSSVCSLLLLIVSIGAVYGVFLLLFGTPDSLLGLYTKQTEEWRSVDVLVAAEAVFLTLFLFIFACGGIFGLFPVVSLSDYEKPKRTFILSFLLGLAAAVIGTAVFVVPYKWTGELGALPLHLRYCSMFIPAMYLFSMDRDLETPKQRRLVTALAAFIVLCLFPGVRAGFVKGHSGTVSSITLDAFLTNRNMNGDAAGWILTALVIGFTVLLISVISAMAKANASRKKAGNPQLKKKLGAVATAGFVFFLLFNSVCAHIAAAIYIDPTTSADALEVNRKISGTEPLGITQRYYDDIYSYWLESRLDKPMQQVTADQMFVQMEETGGVYSPFVPVAQAPNVNTHETPDTDTFVLGMTIAAHLELSDSVTAEKTANGHFTVARIDPSRRWVDSMMYGLDDNALYASSPGYIHIFDASRGADGQLTISLTASGNGSLLVDSERIEITGQARTYELTIPFKPVVSLRAEGGTVQILGYSTR